VTKNVAIIGAGVSGLTCGVVLAESGIQTAIFAAERGQATTSAAAAAIWYPYDTGSDNTVTEWALTSYREFAALSRKPQTGVSMLELRCFARSGEILPPDWAGPLGAQQLASANLLADFTSGFSLCVPLMDTTKYLQYLERRYVEAGGSINGGIRFSKLEELSAANDLVINCSGIGARTLVPDNDLEPHRGQIAIVPKLDLPYAVVCDDPPLMYAIPRPDDCVFGGTNEISDRFATDPDRTLRIVAECSRVLGIEQPSVVAERVGLRPFRKSGVCLGTDKLEDGRAVIHNYGHGGAGFTLSWGCAQRVAELACSSDR
jgi:D-amino-acid oxidase